MRNKLAFLLSAPYSGATLLSILLNQHDEISSDGEIFPFDIRAENQECSCGKMQIDCGYYRNVARSMIRSDGKGFDAQFFYYVPQYSKIHLLSRALEGFWLNPLGHRIRNLLLSEIPFFRSIDNDFYKIQMDFFNKSLAYRRAKIYFDGGKSLRRAEFFAEKNLRPKFVHLIRDGRAFCCSFINNKQISTNERHIKIAANFWLKNIQKIRTLKKRFPYSETITIRYHDLCENPKNELEKISQFLGLNFRERYLQYDNKDMHIMGNRMRFNYKGEIREDKKWKGFFNTNAISIIENQIGKELQSYGFL